VRDPLPPTSGGRLAAWRETLSTCNETERNQSRGCKAAVTLLTYGSMGNDKPKKMLRAPGCLRDPDYWRDRAEQARSIAERMIDNHTCEAMLRIAEGYEEFAEMAARRRNAKNPQ